MIVTTTMASQTTQPKKNSKSRNGCLTCKKKRLKCDETKPKCLNCTNKNIECGGYTTKFKWKSFEETSTSQKIRKKQKIQNEQLSKSMSRAMSLPESNIFQSALQEASLSIAGKTFQELARQNELMVMGMNPNGTGAAEQKSPIQPHLNLTRTLSEGTEIPMLKPQNLMDLSYFHNHEDALVEQDEMSLEEDESRSIFKRSSSVDSVFHSGSKMFMDVPNQSPTNIPHYFLINTCSNDFNREYHMIYKNFFNFTSPIMTIKTIGENSWQKYIWPMALKNSVLFKAITSMTFAHQSKNDEDLKQKSMIYMKQSINELAQGLTNNSISNDVALASCFTLSITESWLNGTRVGIAHLRGARSLIEKILKNQDSITPAFKWLCSSFVYHDVLSKLVSFNLIDSTTYDEDSILTKSLKINNNELIYHSMDDIDPLLGCAHDLFFIIGRTATLITKFRINKKSIDMVSNAVQYQKELLTWKPNLLFISKANDKTTHDPFCDSSSLIATAESYRYATLLYLHQAIPEIPSQTTENLTKKILMLLASIPTNSRTNLLHIFPLFIASCELTNQQDRQWVLNRWAILSKMMYLRNIDRALDVIKEVWKRKDEQNEQLSPRSEHSDLGIEERIEALTNDEDVLENKGINSKTHWSCIMKEFGWEIVLG